MDYEANVEDRFSRVFLNQREKDVVEILVGAKTNGATPLVMACRNGHYDVAEYLIEKCGANIEQSGSVVFDGDTIGGASPLWCASAAGHLALVKLLVKKGAQVNTPTLTRSTPLRAACFDGYFDIVKLLVNHGADIEIANLHGHTSLMIACFKGHINIVRYLLALKADVNRKSARGNTALHDGAESGSLEIVKMLIKYGAKMDADYCGMTPLLTAAITGHRHIVEYFINIPNLVSREEHIDALELLGATYMDKKRDMVGALELWTRAMAERYHPDHPPIPKPTSEPAIAAYNFAREISNPEVLSELNDPDEIRMQALVIRERILGPGHPDTHYCIRYRGAVYADGGQFNRCIELWNYALDVQQSVLDPLDPLTQTSLSNFNDLFNFMLRRQSDTERKAAPLVSREEILRVFKKAVMEVKLGKKMLNKGCEITLQFNKVLVIALHLACLSTLDLPEEGSDEYTALHEAIYELVRIKFVPHVLHVICSGQGTSIGKYTSSKFPSTNLAKALIKVGADVNAKDNEGNTPLHFAAQSHILLWRQDLVITLLEAGAHIDAVNNDGESFETLTRDKRLYHSVKPIKYITLACLAARIVRRTHRLNEVPKHLRSFVQMH
ncbi:protein fem-1 homolog CG6966 isoform X2 [Lasioglossum baleicum]|uniref:protein fem-1 homolog CG6966 isoform X2 n=1 Tax=Lasioglossum baleicum TaxID=434251 RepID=UPI003FCDDBB8